LTGLLFSQTTPSSFSTIKKRDKGEKVKLNSLKRLVKNLFAILTATFCLLAITSCTPGGGGAGPMGGPGGGISGLNPPGGPPEIAGGSPSGPPPPGGGNAATGDDSSGGGTAVQPLGSGVVAPATDVAHDNEPKAEIQSASICSFEDKVKIHIVGVAISGSPLTGNPHMPTETEYYEDGRVLRIVDKLGREYIETKIKSTPMVMRDGRIVSFPQKGIFDVTFILDHLPVEILNYPIAASTLWFYMTDEGYDSPLLDQTQSCPAHSHCILSGWTSLEAPYSSSYIVDAAKNFGACLHFEEQPAIFLSPR
jgi:hypothetical protein